jgi:DNA-binding transcriptional MocR family regulator
MDLLVRIDRAAGRLSAQVAAELRTGIRAGRLAPGTRLPASRDLARQLAVSRGVIVSAYEQLIAEGFLVAGFGDGTRVAPLAVPPVAAAPFQSPAADPGARAGGVRRLGAPYEPLYDLRPGVPDLAAFPRDQWLAALRHVLKTLPHNALGYPDPAGALVLREELAAYLGRVRAAATGPDRIVITHGVAQGLYIVIRALAERGPIALEDPTSDRQLPLLRATGASLVHVPVDGEGINVAALARTGARTVLVTPAHQYPTGVVLSPARRAALIAWARSVDGVIIEDDYDAEFRYDRDPVGCLQGVDPVRVVLAGSVSKSLTPALRLGWIAAPPWLAGAVRGFRAEVDLGAPVFEQHALAQLIMSGSFDRHLRTMRRTYRARRDALASALSEHVPGCRIHGVSAGLHLYVELPGGSDELAVTEAAAEHGVRVVPAAPMWSGPQPHPALVLGYARLTPPHLTEATRLLAQAL